MAELLLISVPDGPRTYSLGGAPLLIGSSSECQVVLDDPGVSPTHCRLRRSGRGYLLEDLQSRSGTQVNGMTVTNHELADGDEIVVGSSTFLFQGSAEELEPEPPSVAALEPAVESWESPGEEHTAGD